MTIKELNEYCACKGKRIVVKGGNLAGLVKEPLQVIYIPCGGKNGPIKRILCKK